MCDSVGESTHTSMWTNAVLRALTRAPGQAATRVTRCDTGCQQNGINGLLPPTSMLYATIITHYRRLLTSCGPGIQGDHILLTA
jgi:hypothetical protein